MPRKRKRKNPGYGIPILAAAVGIPTWAFVTSLVAGTTVGLGVGGAYAYKKWGDVSRFHKDLISKNALNLIQDVEKGYRADNPDAQRAFLDVPGVTTSALRPPPTESAGYAQGALYLAIAAAMDNGNPALLDKAKEFLVKSTSASTDATSAVEGTVKRFPLQQASQLLTNTSNIRFAPVVQRLLSLARPGGVEETMQDVKTYSTSTLAKEMASQTVSDVTTPFRFVHGLWTGNNPFGIPSWQWTAIRWSVIVGGGYVAFRIITGPIRDALEAVETLAEAGKSVSFEAHVGKEE